MNWRIFTGTGEPQADGEAWRSIPPPPPWRDRAVAIRRFVITDELLNAVNTALHLRRPLLLTGPRPKHPPALRPPAPLMASPFVCPGWTPRLGEAHTRARLP